MVDVIKCCWSKRDYAPAWKETPKPDVHIRLYLHNDSNAYVNGDVSELRDVWEPGFQSVHAMPGGGP